PDPQRITEATAAGRTKTSHVKYARPGGCELYFMIEERKQITTAFHYFMYCKQFVIAKLIGFSDQFDRY
ncbi:hypothetical protein, partial [Klebsiella pneumoniae]|uniref:hypothetical protein n=1 Tax=Klebsiella pneumoniae TaxID=573 RepID=UPI001C6ECB0E